MYQIDRQRFGAFVASLRREKGWTQKELAEQLFLSDKAVSKWETGASIPDTALLIPLAELLGVSVTELLLCERAGSPLDASDVEGLVKTAIAYAGDARARAWTQAGRWSLGYAAALLLGGGTLLFGLLSGRLAPDYETAAITLAALGALFGAYFCFFVPLRLPAYYDQNRITAFSDGAFRINVSGLFAFNNRNWPHIVAVGRLSCVLLLALYPALCLLLSALFPAPSRLLAGAAVLVPLLGGLLLPLILAGKKYEA